MKKTMIWLIVGVALLLVGGIAFVCVVTSLDWDFTKLSTSHFEMNAYELEEDVYDLWIKTDTADVTFVPSADGKIHVECMEDEKEKHEVKIENGVLSIEMHSTRKWYDYIGINFQSPKITVAIPAGAYGALSIDLSTGDVEIGEHMLLESVTISGSTGRVNCRASVAGAIRIALSTGDVRLFGLSAGAVDIKTTTGRINAESVVCTGDFEVHVSTGYAVLTDVSCKNLISSGSTGDLTMTGVIAAESFSINRDTGDVRFDGCDAATITVRTDTGDVTGSLLSDKVFITQTDTGKVRVPDSTTGGRCEITTDTGDIRITVQGR